MHRGVNEPSIELNDDLARSVVVDLFELANIAYDEEGCQQNVVAI
jgi:hypothetical protein